MMQNKPKILFLTLFPEIGASSRYRVYQFLPILDKLGYKYHVSTLMSEKQFKISNKLLRLTLLHSTFYSLFSIIKAFFKRLFDVLFSFSYDIIFLQKDLLFPGMERLLKMINPRIVFDYDDAIYAENPSAKGIFKWLSDKRKMVFDNVLKISKVVIVENEYNKKYAANYCGNIVILTGPIDTDRNKPRTNTTDNKRVNIGWIGHPRTAHNLLLIENVFHDILSKSENIDFTFVGCGDVSFIKPFPFKNFPWSLNTEIELLQTFDIGIMPIEDNEWNRGKGGTKLLQYMATGIPCIASPVGVNNEIIIDGVTGYLPHSMEEWRTQISTLINNSELRVRMGLAGRKRAEEVYSLKAAVNTWEIIFKNLMEK